MSDLREEEELEWDSEEIRDVEVRDPTLLVEAIIVWCYPYPYPYPYP